MMGSQKYSGRAVATSVLQQGLQSDGEVARIVKLEEQRQRESIVLIASENFAPLAVREALSTVMQNKYSEGYPGARYYGGNEFIDEMETLCQERALAAFGLDKAQWAVNVQALSGAPANLYVYSALLRPHERIMGLDLPHGGHLSHGYQIPNKKISMVSSYFETMPYRVDETTGLIDYDMLSKTAVLFRPKILIAGASAYARLIDYSRMRQIAQSVGAYLMADIAHISGMMAAGVIPSAFEHCDIVTTTTHKSLRGPRGAMIFFRKGPRSDVKPGKDGKAVMYDLEGPINFSVFPGHQGGPHNHTIAALAVALKQANTPEFAAYQEQVVRNAVAMGKRFTELGYHVVSGGTDTHLILLDLRQQKVDGARVERVMELMGLAANKNTVPGDKSALVPGGVRIGTPAMTSRGFVEEDFIRTADYIHTAVQLASRIDREATPAGGKTKLKEFREYLDNGQRIPEISKTKKEVAEWASSFPSPADWS